MHEPNNKNVILVVEDDFQLLRTIRSALLEAGHEVLFELAASRGPVRILASRPSLVILDIATEELGGLSILRQIRGNFDGPVLLLGDDCEEAEVAALQAGADAYLHKPVRPPLLAAHVDSLLRRNGYVHGGMGDGGQETVRVGELRIDGLRRQVHLRGRRMELRPSEFDLLWELAREPGQVVSREELSQRLLGHSWSAEDRALDIRVARLRRRLEDNARRPRWIHSVRGSGYRLARPDRAAETPRTVTDPGSTAVSNQERDASPTAQ